jgi:hypothetical protein
VLDVVVSQDARARLFPVKTIYMCYNEWAIRQIIKKRKNTAANVIKNKFGNICRSCDVNFPEETDFKFILFHRRDKE